MESSDKDLKKSHGIEQMAVIGKMHNMQWLKSNSQLSGHTKTFPDGKEVVNRSHRIKINEGTKESTEIISTNISNSSELESIDHIPNENIYKGNDIMNKDTFHSTLAVVDFSQKNIMESVWNKDANVTSTVLQNSQSLAEQRLDKQEEMSLSENIVTVQLENFSFNEKENPKSSESCNESVNNWEAVHDTSETVKSDIDVDNQVNQKQCHDNNNNNAKSKAQVTAEVKKGAQRVTTKINNRKLNDQKYKKQTGNLKESYAAPKQGFKEESLNSSSDDKTSTSTVDSKKMPVGIMPKINDKYGKVNGCNKQLIMGKGARMKEQQFFKQHFSTLNDSSNRNKSPMEGLDERNKSFTAKLKPPRNEPDKRNNDTDDSKQCHKVQVTRTQSYNVQYYRNKPLLKSQQRYVRSTTRLEEESSIKRTTGFNNNSSVSNSNESLSKKKCENQPIVNKQTNDIQSAKSSKNVNVQECNTNAKSSNPVACKRSCSNFLNAKNNTERNVKDDQGHVQKFRRDSNVYRRSSDYAELRNLNAKAKMDEHKRNISDNNSVKDYRLNRMCSVDAKMRSQQESSRITVYPHKTMNGASDTNKTDTLDSSTVNNVQSVKSLNSCSNSTKDIAGVSSSNHTPQESQTSQASCNGTGVQFVKTEQEDISINASNNKTSTSITETKSVKFSDNVQEINMPDHSAASYPDNSMQQNSTAISPFYSDLSKASNTAQQPESHQTVQNKSYFDTNNAQYSNTSANIQDSERDTHVLEVAQPKVEQVSYVSPQNMSPQSNCNPPIAMGNGLAYQNMHAAYLNQYSNTTQAVPRKIADTVVSQNGLVSSTSTYPVEGQNMVQSDGSNVMMHNTQTSVLPPPGFHSHPMAAQHNQWNLPLPDVFLFGNMMNPAHPLNIQIQNPRHVCNTDYNNIQQPGYVQHPLFYVPPVCMQGWNPLLQYPAPIFQNASYANCNTLPTQVLPPSTLTDTINCPATTSVQNNPYKPYQQVQQFESNPSYTVPMKLVNYMGNMQGCKGNNSRVKDANMDVHGRTSQYRPPVPNEYQNCSQEGQPMVPYSYAITMDPNTRNGPPNMHLQTNQKYAQRVLLNYQRMPDSCSTFQNNQEASRKDDASKNEPDCIPPMVSPKECMYYGVNYARKTDNVQNVSARSDVKSVPYVHSANSQHFAPQFHKTAAYHGSQKELGPRTNVARGARRAMDQ